MYSSGLSPVLQLLLVTQAMVWCTPSPFVRVRIVSKFPNVSAFWIHYCLCVFLNYVSNCCLTLLKKISWFLCSLHIRWSESEDQGLPRICFQDDSTTISSFFRHSCSLSIQFWLYHYHYHCFSELKYFFFSSISLQKYQAMLYSAAFKGILSLLPLSLTIN